MNDKFIIGIVVSVALIAHIWIFKWVKFKIDEATIVNYIKQHSATSVFSTDTLSLNTHIKLARVTEICAKSRAITAYIQEKEKWVLS